MARLLAASALAAAALLLAVAGPGPGTRAAPPEDAYDLTLFASEPEFDRIVDLALIPGVPDEAVVATQESALIWRISLSGAFSPVLYGDLSALASGGGEQGLLSITFSPEFQTDGRLYAYYTEGSPDPSVLSRFDATATALDDESEQVILEVPQFASNHNGGRLLFGPDGYLYLSLGDGGGSGDPAETGQDNTDLPGSVLRIDVTGETTYSVPADNPFVGVAGADEVWAYGLRNPWRYSFDRLTGELWLADVGQGQWEEVQEIVKGGNYGWDCYEGFAVYEPAGCPAGGFEFPRAVYDHGLGCSVTGGYVYRGAALADLYGWYVYGDYCSGRIWAVNPVDSSDPVQLVDSPYQITSFAELPDGELLVLTFQDAIYRLDCDDAFDADGDGEGDACDADDDGDGVSDLAEAQGACDADPLDPAVRPERLDGAFAGVDDDGDTLVDEGLPAGSETFDCDGDGWTGEDEQHVFSAAGTASDQDPCGSNGWAADIIDGGITPNGVDIQDITDYITPDRFLGTDVADWPGQEVEARRHDVSPGSDGLGPEINILDLTLVVVSAPPMLDGARNFGSTCPWPG